MGRIARRAFVALALLVSSLASLLPPTVARASGAFERWGFYVTYDPASRASLLAHIDQLDVVVPDYFGMNADGTIVGSDDRSVDAIVRSHQKRLLPMVQNHVTYGSLGALLDDPARRRVAVTSVVDAVTDHEYDGVTLDFEGVSPGDRANLTAYVRAVADALHQRGKSLAVAIPARSGDLSTGWAGAFDDAAIGAAADHSILMAYAFRTAASKTPGPISPLPWVQSVTDYARSRIPADRLVLGIGVWGYNWTSSDPKRAQTLGYRQTTALVSREGGQPSFDPNLAAATYSYQANGQSHEVWFENPASILQKVEVARRQQLAGVAFWRLGQEPPEVWSQLDAPTRSDFAIPNGWFYTQTGGDSGLGYRVTDDDRARFWTAFRRLGGVATLGYPSSRRFVGSDGFTYQVFQRGVLQWRPELGIAELANSFEQLTAAGWDARLAQQGIPAPVRDDGSGGDWTRARQIRLSWLTNSAIAAAFYANPSPSTIDRWSVDRSIQLYGLPESPPVRSGPFVVQRFQRISLQLWIDDVPGMPARGSVVGILGGDLDKQAGLVPPSAAAPETPTES
ncbi:MAG: glycosyl hydrolase family 18 protein [Chloroflexota bacterium]